MIWSTDPARYLAESGWTAALAKPWSSFAARGPAEPVDLDVAARHIRFVFSREPIERLALLGDRVRAALADLGASI